MSRQGGVAAVPRGEHRSLVYEGDGGFLPEGLAFLAAGAAGGDRLLYASGRSEDRMRADVAGLPSSDELLATGDLTVMSYAARVHLPLAPEDQLAFVAAETERAVADGYRGLRVLADLTGLVRVPPRRPELLRYEHLADRFTATAPMTALCAVDRSAVGDEHVANLECVHSGSAGSPALSGFRLLPEDDGLRLTGVVDAWDADRLREVVRALAAGSGQLRLHLDTLEFIGARGLAALALCRRDLASAGAHLTVKGARSVTRRACGVLGLDLVEESS